MEHETEGARDRTRDVNVCERESRWMMELMPGVSLVIISTSLSRNPK